MKKNFFDDKNKEYIIGDMFPKRPWLNYAWNDSYVSCFSQFGFGMSRYTDRTGFMRSILQVADNRLIWIKDEKTGEYYAANRNYDNKPFDVFNTQVGMGYSKINSEYNGIETTLKLFVPTSGLMEFWEVEVTNKSDEEKEISVYSHAEIDMAMTCHHAYSGIDFDKGLNGIYCSHEAYKSPTCLSGVYFATNREVTSYETSSTRFRGVCSDAGHPIAMKEDTLSNCGTCFENEITAVMQFELKLKPNQTEKLLFVLGASENKEQAQKVAKTVLSEKMFEDEFKKLVNGINEFQDNVVVETPDAEINSRVNIWLKRQIELGKQWGRLCGKGFRDIMQDITGFVSLDNKNARARILYALQYQREDGNPIRLWEPLMTEVYVDGAVWMIYTVNVYLKESGDFSILDEKVKYYESDIEETVLEHCLRGMSYVQDNLGEHGLCLWGEGDWNDSLNGCGILGRGESLWLSEATIKAANEIEEILRAAGKEEYIKPIREKADLMKENIFKYGWDKDHFIYGINDYGEKIGSYDTEEGQIFLNSQTWAVLAGIIEGEEAEKLMKVVEDKLGCDFGYVQQWPSHTKGTDKIGRSSYFQPGCYENGSVYNHGVSFKLVADALMNNGDRAFETLNRILPFNPKNNYVHSGVEPYAMTNMYLGPECKTRCGEAPASWITGTCGWLFRGVVEFIIGVSADFKGLKIKPNLPKCWDKVKVKRVYRGCEYNITIEGVHSRENFKIMVDGKEIEGNIVPSFADKKAHEVVVLKA